MPTTVAALVESLSSGTPAAGTGDRAFHGVRLDVSGCSIDIVASEARLRDKLARYFREMVVSDDGSSADFVIVAVEGPPADLDVTWTVKEPEPGKTKIKEEWVDLPDGRIVRKRLTGMVFAFGGDLHFAYGPCFDNDNQVINFVNNRYMQWRLQQGYVLVHAGAVGQDGRCLAVCGPSGAGKSTAALGLVGEGFDFVSNDRLLMRLEENGLVTVHGIPKHPRVNPGTIVSQPGLGHMIPADEQRKLRALPEEELRVLEDKYDVLIDDFVGRGRFRMQGVLEALVIVNWTDEGEPTAKEIDLNARRELLPLITKSPGLFYEPDPGVNLDLSDDRYVETLAGTRVVEITGRRDFESARRLCREVLAS